VHMCACACARAFNAVLDNTITDHLGYSFQPISQAIIRPVTSRALQKTIQKPCKFMWEGS